MTSACGPVMDAVLAGESSRWTCRELADGVLLLVTSRQFSDGDLVELLVQVDGDQVTVSDGGEVLARLDSIGVRVDTGERMSRSWAQLLTTHALELDRGQLLRRGALTRAGDLVVEMADAVANVDAVRLLAPVPRRLPFPEQVTTYLQAEFPVVEPRPKLAGHSGISHQLTAAAGTKDRLVYIQTASGQNAAAQKVSMEHSFTLFSDVNGHVPVDQKLVVLDDDTEWRPELVTLLSTVAFVGSWNDRDRWTEFVWGRLAEKSRVLLSSIQPTFDEV